MFACQEINRARLPHVGVRVYPERGILAGIVDVEGAIPLAEGNREKRLREWLGRMDVDAIEWRNGFDNDGFHVFPFPLGDNQLYEKSSAEARKIF